ncbi:uncharacterized protein LOC131956487 [Physella acuta]|uniref:uncharacterized protein LOC131956487 n=1 Tax=Physella acuta TaxID=109671 RepID=UPI0027DE3F88|nr:uncharacterized protein LOC131956487 [Physella acuta]
MAANQKRPPLKKHVSSFHIPKSPLHSGELKLSKNGKTPKETEKNLGKLRPPLAKSKQQPVTTTGKATDKSKLDLYKATEEIFDFVLEGKLTVLPPLPRSTVRIFLSSTFSDMRAERNALAKDAYPRLRDYCAQLGLGFQVVDLRWGVTAEATNNHMTTNICLLELENCQKVSVGPSCIAIIGNRYGYCPLPFEISDEEFQILKSEALHLQLTEVFSLVETWYKKDENAIPAAYYLQPISSQLPYFLDNSSNLKTEKLSHQQTWAKTEAEMLETIHRCAVSAWENKKISTARKHCYLMSVTEHEARNGIIQAKDPNSHGLVFLRELEGLSPQSYADVGAARHKDLVSVEGQLQADQQADQLISGFKKDLQSSLQSSNVKSYTVPWVAGGLQPETIQHHSQYLNQFCQDFVSGVQQLIQADMQAMEALIRQQEYYSLYSEVLHHAHFCRLKCQTFCGQQDSLDLIRDYILDPSNRKPFVIFAQSGLGKTSLLAMAMNLLGSWIKDKHIGVIQFLGTSALSTNIYNVLFNVCGQLADITESIMEPQCYRSMKTLVAYMPRFFRTIASIVKQPVVIFLDSLDQLSSQHDAHTMWWLPSNLPPNFKLIVSTLPDRHGILDNLIPLISHKKNFVEMPFLPDSTSSQIAARYLGLRRRRVTDQQMMLLLERLRASPSPLYLKLLLDQAVLWSSHTPVSELVLPDSVRVGISHMFEKLEVKFGQRFVQAALGLISVGLNGLSEIELEDALSCMDDVMVEIYQFHDPPVPGMVRIPPVMWARLRFDLKEYLVERLAQGQTTLFWYHRQFVEVASERYTSGITGQNLHKILFEYFAAEHGVKRDIVLTERNNLFIPNADRNTSPQPMAPSNIRKLECLTYHLKSCTSLQDPNFAKQVTYCNFHFIRAKIATVGAEKLLLELEEQLQLVRDSELEKMVAFIGTCSAALKDPVGCAFNVLAHISTSPQLPNLNLLIAESRSYLKNLSRTLLIPTFACLAPRGSEPEKVYNGLVHVKGRRNETVLFANEWCPAPSDQESKDASVTIGLVDMKTTDVSYHPLEGVSSELFLTADGKALIFFSAEHAALVKLQTDTGTQTLHTLKDLLNGQGPHVKQAHLYHALACTSEDLKHIAISVGDVVAVADLQDMRPVARYQLQHTAHVTNLHCCSGSPLTLILTQVKHTHSPGAITFLDILKREVTHCTETTFEILPRCSAVTLNGESHVCYGNNPDGNVILLSKIKPAGTYLKIDIKKQINGMEVSSVDQDIYFHIGDSEIQVLNAETQGWTRTLEHGIDICCFDVSWDDKRLLVADVSNTITLYNKQFDKLFTRHESCSGIDYIAVYHSHVVVQISGVVKIWNEKELFKVSVHEETATESASMQVLHQQDDVTCFLISEREELFTAGQNQICRVWSMKDDSFVREFNLGLAPTEMMMAVHDVLVAFCEKTKRLVAVKSKNGEVHHYFDSHVFCFTLTKDKNKLVFLTKEKVCSIHVYDITTNSLIKKFNVGIHFPFLSARLLMSVSERYAVFMLEVSQEEIDAITAMRNKGTQLPAQQHPHRFLAVDLTQGTGAPMHVYHRLSKVPQLGVTVEPYKGNMVMVSTRRWVLFWDIPTGNCDHMMCKSPRQTKMYRPDWLGQECVGSNDVITMSRCRKYVAVGSRDGYLFVYDGETGMPAGMKAPASKHPSPVNQACFNQSSTLVASSCTGGHLKLWDPKTGNSVFSISVGLELQHLEFSPKGHKLVAVTAEEKSRVLVFDVQYILG